MGSPCHQMPTGDISCNILYGCVVRWEAVRRCCIVLLGGKGVLIAGTV